LAAGGAADHCARVRAGRRAGGGGCGQRPATVQRSGCGARALVGAGGRGRRAAGAPGGHARPHRWRLVQPAPPGARHTPEVVQDPWALRGCGVAEFEPEACSGTELPRACPQPAQSPRICRPSPCRLWCARAGRDGSHCSPANALAPPLIRSAIRPCASPEPCPPRPARSRRGRAPQALAAVLHTPTALCLVDFAAPAPPPPAARTGAQRRADRRARRPRDEGLGHRPGDNFRVLPLEHPCLHAGYLAPAAALLARARRAGRGAWVQGSQNRVLRRSPFSVWVLRAPGWGMARRAADLSVLQSVKLCISSQLGHTADCTCYCWLRQPKTAAARACAGGEAMGGGGGRLPAAAAPASLRLVMTWLCCRVRAGLSAAHDFAMGRCCAAVCASECFHMSAVTVWWLVQGLWVHAIP